MSPVHRGQLGCKERKASPPYKGRPGRKENRVRLVHRDQLGCKERKANPVYKGHKGHKEKGVS